MSVLKIPWRELSDSALQGVIEEFATREGTEYGVVDVTLEVKVMQIRRQMERGDLALFFDDDSATCQLLRRDALPAAPGESA